MKTVMTMLGVFGAFAAGVFVTTAAISACIYDERNETDKQTYNILYDCGKTIRS